MTSDRVVELRVHGVSGAGADQVLDRPHVQQVAGDRSAGFYRPRAGYPGTTGSGGVTLEAYRWSDLPSGTVMRTLSLVFLLPFMLCNVALWMRPASRVSKHSIVALCRVLALTLTILYVLSIVGVALDLIAWRCMGTPSCLDGRTWLSWLGEHPVGLRLGVLSLVPVAAIGVVWWLGARPGHSFDAFRTPVPATSVHRLSAVGQWDAAPMVGRLRSVHVAAAFATLDGSLLAARASDGTSLPMVLLLAATGHSHGSVLLAATVLQLPSRITDRVALTTYGSPLSRLYGRLFPAYVDDGVLREIGERVGWCWVNLWHDTDPIGGWIFDPHRPGGTELHTGPAAAVDRRLKDPHDVVPPPSDSVPPPIMGHWPCEAEEAFAAAVRDLAHRLRTDRQRQS